MDLVRLQNCFSLLKTLKVKPILKDFKVLEFTLKPKKISVKLRPFFVSGHLFPISITRLKEKTAEFEKRGMRLSQICSVGEPLRLGRLQGNHFDLVVRDLRPHGATDTNTNTHTRLAGLVQEAVENVEVVLIFAHNSVHYHIYDITLVLTD